MEVWLTHLPGRHVGCTVLSVDLPGIFSLITGVLAGMGTSIVSGDVFTYRSGLGRRTGRRRRSVSRGDRLPGRPIIDHFVARRETDEPFASWAETLEREMVGVIEQLVGGRGQRAGEAAKQRANEMVTRRIASSEFSQDAVLYPVKLHVEQQSGTHARLQVLSQDTPAFLYTLSTALLLHGLSIERVRIRTSDNQIEDEIDFVDTTGRGSLDAQTLNKVKLSVLLTKQFTYFLKRAPDPYTALSRFEKLTEDIVRLPDSVERARDLPERERIGNPRAMADLAGLLGASDFLWEDFVRLQYESLIPILKPQVEGRRFGEAADALPARLDEAMASARTSAEKRKALNAFKDREIFLIDLDHILNPGTDFREMSERLTALAEVVVSRAAAQVFEDLRAEHGTPRADDGAEAKYAVFGLGKLGGAALGYGSDIELLFLFDKNGRTDGKRPIENAAFFEHLASETSQFIETKREGIFEVDLRLRPYGKDGPLASSLEAFKRYYTPGGPAHSMERLALVRMRTIAGDPSLGEEVGTLRDNVCLDPNEISLEELREARAGQYAQYSQKKSTRGRNAKYSCGALADLEAPVQILQVWNAGKEPRLRTPRIHQAIDALRAAGVLGNHEGEQITVAYDFFRRLINGLRMLRGSAKDLYLPPVGSDEYTHLARRLGYVQREGLDPAEALRTEFATQTATVRAFVARHFGRWMLPNPRAANLADMVLDEHLPDDLRVEVLRRLHFEEPESASSHMAKLSEVAPSREQLARLLVLSFEILDAVGNRDEVLERWAKLVDAHPEPEGHLSLMWAQPVIMRVVLTLLGRGQILSDLLVSEPRVVEWISHPRQLLDATHIDAVETKLQEILPPAELSK